jgi:hypothetical protein
VRDVGHYRKPMINTLLLALLSTVPYVHHTPVLEDFVRVQADPAAHAAGMVRIDMPGSQPAVVYVGHDDDALYAAFIYFDAELPAIRVPLGAWELCANTHWSAAMTRTPLGVVALITVPRACENEIGSAS